MTKYIEKYTNPELPGSFSGISSFIRELKKTDRKIDTSNIKKAISSIESYTLHRPLRKKFLTLKTIVSGIDDTWQADLVDVHKIAKENDGFNYLLTIIDVFSKFAWVVPIKRKDSISVVNAFNTVFSGPRKPRRLHVDEGSEFFNKDLKKLLQRLNIKLYHTFSEKKASIVERFNRTLKERMWRLFTHYDNNEYLSKLQKLVDSYNKTFHRSIKTRPIDVNKNNEKDIWLKLYGYDYDNGTEDFVKPKFKKDDLVRITKKKFVFSKGYTPNWTDEIFIVTKVVLSVPPVYYIKDRQGQLVDGKFYAEELQIITDQELPEGEYRYIPLEEKRDKKGKLISIKVHWLGYPDSMDSWIKPTNITK